MSTEADENVVTFSLWNQCWSEAATVPLCCLVWRRESNDDQSNTGFLPPWAGKADGGPLRPLWVSLSTLQTPLFDLK